MKYHPPHNTHIFRDIKNLAFFSLWLVIPFLSNAVWKAKLAISTLLCNISLLWSPNTEIKLGRTASQEGYRLTKNYIHIFRTIKFPHFDFPKVSELWGILELVNGYYIHRVGGGGVTTTEGWNTPKYCLLWLFKQREQQSEDSYLPFDFAVM